MTDVAVADPATSVTARRNVEGRSRQRKIPHHALVLFSHGSSELGGLHAGQATRFRSGVVYHTHVRTQHRPNSSAMTWSMSTRGLSPMFNSLRADRQSITIDGHEPLTRKSSGLSLKTMLPTYNDGI